MISDYLVVPIGLEDLTITDTMVLSQLAYLKRSYSTITASNNYICTKLRISISTVKRSINALIIRNYIISNYFTKNNKTKRTILLTEKTKSIYGLDVVYSKMKKKSNILKQFLEGE
jgi:DNA-binding MarR family transcriptional regulator